MELIGTVLPLALVVGLSPLPIMPAVLLLLGPNARRNGPAYLAAWVVALTLVVLIALWLGNRADPGPATDEGIGWLQVITGSVFLVMGLVKWLRRAPEGEVKAPSWLAALDSYTPVQAARLGALLAAANPKNLPMALAAGAEIAVFAESGGRAAWGVILFVVISSVVIATPILAQAVLGARAEPWLRRAKAWLDVHGERLAVGVLVVLGALLVIRGLPAAI